MRLDKMVDKGRNEYTTATANTEQRPYPHSTPRIYFKENRHRIYIVFALGILCFATCIAMLYVFFTMGKDKAKLFMDPSEDNRPVEYFITLKLNMTDFSYIGNVSVILEVMKNNTKIIQLHSNGLIYHQIKMYKVNTVGGNSEIVLRKINLNNDVMTMESTSRLQKGTYQINFDFTGNVSDDMEGIYRSRYDINGKQHYLVTTQFEAVAARRSFPCWDLPSFKAYFNLGLIIPSDLTAISNMPVKDAVVLNKREKHVKFEKTPLMSTYLLAFAIGHFDYIQSVDSTGLTHRVYTTKGKSHLGKFALNISLRTLPFFTEYFNISYPLPKLDLIAIPDFSFGAMENWGLMTFREQYLLVDNLHPEVRSMRIIALTVGHEIAHQWFGNLVTMRKWTELWLNEGFATWIEYFNVDNLFPDMEIWTQFVVENMKLAMLTDYLKNTHPIQINVILSRNVMEVFDVVSYSKGAAIIRMIHEFIGVSKFKQGLRHYLRKHMYKNIDTVDLWNSLSFVSMTSVDSIMSKWTQEPGFPVVHVEKTVNGEDVILHFKQTRFLADGGKDKRGTVWSIFVTISDDKHVNENVHRFLMSTKKYKYTIRDGKSRKWFKVNVGKIGFYVVDYSDEMLNDIEMNLHSLEEIDRFDVQSDLFFLSISGRHSIVDYFEFVQGYANETSLLVWRDVCENLNSVAMILEYTDDVTSQKLFRSFRVELYNNIVEKLNWDPFNDEDKTSLLYKAAILREAGFAGMSEVIEKSMNVLQSAMNGSLTSEYRYVVLSIESYYGSKSFVEKLIEIHRDTAKELEEKNNILQCIGYTQDPVGLWHALEYNFLSGHVRKQDISYMVQAASNTRVGREITWNFFVKHFNHLSKVLKRDYLLAKIVKRAFNNFASDEDLNRIKQFFSGGDSENEYTLKQLYERITIRSKLVKREAASVRKYLHDKLEK